MKFDRELTWRYSKLKGGLLAELLAWNEPDGVSPIASQIGQVDSILP